MNISIYNSQKDLKILRRSVKPVIEACVHYYKINCDEISIHFVTSNEIGKLHEKYFNDLSPTDCISLSYDETFLSGEIFVCPSTAKEYVAKKNLEVYEEVTLYLIHGFLHLIGYDDVNPLDRKKMRNQEKKLMKYLKDKKILLSP